MASATTSCETFDPNSGQWTSTGSMVTNRQSHTTVLLPDGKVLVCGGHNNIEATTRWPMQKSMIPAVANGQP